MNGTNSSNKLINNTKPFSLVDFGKNVTIFIGIGAVLFSGFFYLIRGEITKADQDLELRLQQRLVQQREFDNYRSDMQEMLSEIKTKVDDIYKYLYSNN